MIEPDHSTVHQPTVRLCCAVLVELRDEFRAKGDTLASRIVDRALVRVARTLVRRLGEGLLDATESKGGA